MVLALFPFVLLALYPPTAFDATMYHLPYAKGFVESGGIPFLRDLRFPVFPQANEMLFALVLLFAPDVAAHGVQWLMTMLTAALVWAWGRDAFAERGPAAAWLAAAIFLGSPLVAYLAGTGYIEAGLTLFATAAFYSLRRWRLSGERRWLVLAAVFAATAADVKYIGLFFVGVIGLAVVFGRLPRRSPRGRLAAVALFTLVGCAVLAPWYGRIYAWTGNPFFPFFPQVFGGGPWAPLRFRSFLVHPNGAGAVPAVPFLEVLAARLTALVRLPWDVAFDRARYNGEPPVSPLFLAALPLALLAAVRDGRQRRLVGLAALYAFVCLGLPPDSRYLVPALPLDQPGGGRGAAGRCCTGWGSGWPTGGSKLTAALRRLFPSGLALSVLPGAPPGAAAADPGRARGVPGASGSRSIRRSPSSTGRGGAPTRSGPTMPRTWPTMPAGASRGTGSASPATTACSAGSRARRTSMPACAESGPITCSSPAPSPCCRSPRTPPSGAGSRRSMPTPTPACIVCAEKDIGCPRWRWNPIAMSPAS